MAFDMRSLDPFLGTWRGSGELFASPWQPAGACRGAWTFRRDSGGHNVIFDYEENRADGGVFQGHGVWCADADDLLWFWFDSYGFPPLSPSRGGWRGDALVLEKSTPRGLGRSRWTCDGRDLTYLVEAQPVGQAALSLVMSGRYRRVVGF